MATEHPTRLTEPLLLANVRPRFASTYASRREHPGLSPEQRETLMSIFQSHETPCADATHTRKGFLLGDSTGSGKGRIIASAIAEQIMTRDGHPALWVSANRDLSRDAMRDLRDICTSAESAPVVYVNSVGAFATKLRERVSAVLFCSYHYLRVHVDQIVLAIGPAMDPVVVFDESHISKNAAGVGSKIATSVVRLQEGVPQARVLYSSATAMNNVRGMLHMNRLHIWGMASITGSDAPFTTARKFVQAISGMGRTAPELLAVEMKRRGVYSSRTLDLSHIQLKTVICDTSHRRELFHRCVAVWNEIRRAHSGETAARGTPFWMSHQRFFRTLLTEMKVKETIRLTEESLRAGKSVVIVLQLTGESSQRRGQGDAGLLRQTRSACPPGWTPPGFDGLHMPTNPIDQLIVHFGTDQVAEISGRKVRRVSMVDDAVQRRTISNADECDAFVRGHKHVAIITRSGTSGISLHDTNEEHSRPRVQIFLELPWDAPTFVQQCGRVNRTRQLSKPEIVCLVTDIPAEVRYMHTLVRNVEDLSSITRGDRSCIPNIPIPGGVNLAGAIPWFIHWLSMHRIARLASTAAEHVAQVPYVYRHSRTRDAKRELECPPTVETPSADALQRHLLHALTNRGISLTHAMHPPTLTYDDACDLHASVPSFFILPVYETHVGYVTRVIPSMRMMIDHNSTRIVTSDLIARAASCRFRREDLYRHYWDPMAYVCFLVHCYESLGGKLPPMQWSTEGHHRFPAPFRRACRWLVWYRAQASTALISDRSLHTIMSMASTWYNTRSSCASTRDIIDMDMDICPSKVDSCGFMNRAMSLTVCRQQALFDGVRSVYDGYLSGDMDWAPPPRDDAAIHTDTADVHEVRVVRSEQLDPSLDVWLHDLRLTMRMRPSFTWSAVESKIRLSGDDMGVVYRQIKTQTLMLQCGQTLWSCHSNRVAYCRKPAEEMRTYLTKNFVRVGATDAPLVRQEWTRALDAQAQDGFNRVFHMNLLTGDTMRFWEPMQQWLRYVNSCRVSKMTVRVVKVRSQTGVDARPNLPLSRMWIGIKIPGGFKERVQSIVRHAAESASRKRRRDE